MAINQLNFPVAQNNFRFEPPNFLVMEWMLIFFRFKEEFSGFRVTFFRFQGWGRGVVSMAGGWSACWISYSAPWVLKRECIYINFFTYGNYSGQILYKQISIYIYIIGVHIYIFTYTYIDMHKYIHIYLIIYKVQQKFYLILSYLLLLSMYNSPS